MAIWEYKVISSGKGGFATPVMLEKFLNDLGKEEWEIIEYKTPADNSLAFNGLARRPTQRDWTLEDAAASAAKEEADKLRSEFEAKFKGLAPVGEDSALADKVSPEDGYRSPVDTSRDQDPDADDEVTPKDEWQQLMEDDDLPTFFEAMRPHMRRNQRGSGVSVGVSFLANKWNFDDADIIGALQECGFEIPDDENAKPVYIDYDGDLFWVNINRRGELWINTKEKPLPVFRTVAGARVEVEEAPKKKDKKPAEKPKAADKPKETDRPAKVEKPEQVAKSEKAKPVEPAGKPLPKGEALLALIRPKMRRRRRDPGHSGSIPFLTRALKCSAEELQAAFGELGLTLPENKDDKSEPTVIGDELWWLNRDSHGGVWINGRENKQDDGDAAKAADKPKSNILSVARPYLTTVRKGTASQEIEGVAEKLAKPVEEILVALVAAGLEVPDKPRQKPVDVEQGEEIFWLSLNAKKQVLLNAKATEKSEAKPEEVSEKPVAKPAKEEVAPEAIEKKTKRPRTRKNTSAKKKD